MKTEDRRIAYWVTGSLMLDGETQFVRASAVPSSILGEKFLLMWRVQQAHSRGFESANDERLKNLQLYRVGRQALIDPLTTLAEQTFSDGEVLVLLPERAKDAVDVVSAQEFPSTLDLKLAPVNASISWKEIHMRQQERSPGVSNTVTINLGAGAQFSGPVAIGQTVSQAYSVASGESNDELRKHLESLTQGVAKVLEQTESLADKNEIAEQLSIFVQQATKETPSRRMLQVTGEGLVEAAKTVAAMAAPITTAVRAVLALLT